jgi:hypothetical protein
MAGNFVVGQTSKVVIYAGMATEATVKGLNSMNAPLGWEASTTTISEFGVPIDVQVASGLAYETVSCSGNFTLKDPTQALLRQWSMNATQIQHMRFYLDSCSFAALDLINNPDGYYQVAKVSSPSGEKNGVYSFSVDFTPAGPSTLFENHISGTTLSFTAGATPTVTDSASGFLTAGFAVGQVAIVDHLDGANPMYLEILTVVAGTMTFANKGDAALVTTDVGVATTAIHSGAPMAFSSSSTVC